MKRAGIAEVLASFAESTIKRQLGSHHSQRLGRRMLYRSSGVLFKTRKLARHLPFRSSTAVVRPLALPVYLRGRRRFATLMPDSMSHSDPALGDGGSGGTIGRSKAGMMVQPQGDKR
jgi:hypothetical protein